MAPVFGRRPDQPEPQKDPLPDDHAGYKPGYKTGPWPGDPWPIIPAPVDDICHMGIKDPLPGQPDRERECGRQKRWREGTRPNRGVYLCPSCDDMHLTPDEAINGRSNRPYTPRPFDGCATDPLDHSKPHNCKHCKHLRRNSK